MPEFYFVHSVLGQIVLFVMLLVFLIALYHLLKQILRFSHTEVQDLDQAKRNYDVASQPEHSVTKKHLQLVEGCAPSIVRDRINSIYYVTVQNQLINQQNLIDNSHIKEEAQLASVVVRYARPAIVILALLGVAYGLMQFFGKLSYVNSITEPATILPIYDALLSMFAGLLFIAVLSILQIPLQWNKLRFFAELESFTTNYLLPLFNPSSTSHQLNSNVQTLGQHNQKMKELSSQMQDTAASMNADFSIASQFTNNLNNSIQAYVSAQDAMQEQMTGLTQLIANYRQQNQSNFEVMEALNLHNVTLDNVNKKLHDTTFNIDDWLKQIISLSQKQQGEFKESLKLLLDLSRSSMSSTQSAAIRFNNSIDKFEKSLDKLAINTSQFDTALKDTVEEQIEKLNQLSKQVANLALPLQQIKAEVNQQLSQMAQAMHNTNKIADPQYVQGLAQDIAEREIKKRMAAYEKEYHDLEKRFTQLRDGEKSSGFSAKVRNILGK